MTQAEVCKVLCRSSASAAWSQLHVVGHNLHSAGKPTTLQLRKGSRHWLSHSAKVITEPSEAAQKALPLMATTKLRKLLHAFLGWLAPQPQLLSGPKTGHLACIAWWKPVPCVMQLACLAESGANGLSRWSMYSHGPLCPAGPGRTALPQAEPAEGCHAC